MHSLWSQRLWPQIPALPSTSFANLNNLYLIYLWLGFWPLVQFSSVQSLSHVQLFLTPWIASHQASLSITNHWSLLKFIPLSLWCHPTISSSVVPFSHLQPFPASGCFPISQFFASGGQSIGVSASASSFQWIFKTDFLYDGLLGSPFRPKDSQESSATPQFKSINSLAFSFLYSLTPMSILDYWKNHSFD